jgi:hypothetical protein
MARFAVGLKHLLLEERKGLGKHLNFLLRLDLVVFLESNLESHLIYHLKTLKNLMIFS